MPQNTHPGPLRALLDVLDGHAATGAAPGTITLSLTIPGAAFLPVIGAAAYHTALLQGHTSAEAESLMKAVALHMRDHIDPTPKKEG